MKEDISLKKKLFSSFIMENSDEIYSTTPKMNVISKDDEWINENEWDDFFKELKTKEAII